MIDGMITVIHLSGPKEQIGDVNLICTLLKEIVKAIGMTPHGEPQVTYYPSDSNAKDTHTVLLPISSPFLAAQYLHESFIIYDNWPEVGYAHLIVDSCKPYELTPIILTIANVAPDFNISIPDAPVRYGEWIFR